MEEGEGEAGLPLEGGVAADTQVEDFLPLSFAYVYLVEQVQKKKKLLSFAMNKHKLSNMYSGGASRSSSLIKTAGAAWVGYQVEHDRIYPKKKGLSLLKKM